MRTPVYFTDKELDDITDTLIQDTNVLDILSVLKDDDVIRQRLLQKLSKQ